MLQSLLVSILSAPAGASELPTVGVVGLHQRDLTTEAERAAIEGIVAAIESGGRFDALVPGEVAGTIRGREKVILEEGLLEGARANLTNGKNAYNQANSDEALAYLQAAIDDFRSGIPATNTVDELWEAWLYVGTSHLQKETPDEEAARAAFANAIALAPSRPANPAVFPPNVIELFDAVKADLQPRAVTLQVGVDASTPAPGELTVWLDGVERGKAPVTIEGVLPGEHHVVMRGKGTQGYTRVDVPKAEPATPPPVQPVAVAIRLPSLGDPARAPVGRSNQVQALYTALGNRAEGLDYVLVAGVDGSVLYLHLLDPRADTFSKAVEIPFADTADDEAIAGVPLLLGVVGKDGGFTATAPTPAPLDVGAGSELALLLTQPIDTPIPIAGTGGSQDPGGSAGGGKKKTGLVVGLLSAVVVAGGAGTGAYLLTREAGGNAPTGQTGTVVVNF